MVWLGTGVTLWALAHLVKPIFPSFRQSISDKLGVKTSQAPFAVLILISVGLIIAGWHQTEPGNFVYFPNHRTRLVTLLFSVVGIYFIVASVFPLRLKILIRHPQLVGFILWSIAHLVSNGEVRSIILFGGFAVWAAVSILFINKRDGQYTPPKPGSLTLEVIAVIATLFVSAAMVLFHGWISGVPLAQL